MGPIPAYRIDANNFTAHWVIGYNQMQAFGPNGENLNPLNPLPTVDTFAEILNISASTILSMKYIFH